MIEIDSKGNEKIADGIIAQISSEIKKATKNRKAVFVAIDGSDMSLVSGDAVEILATAGTALECFFKSCEKRFGSDITNKLFVGFVEGISNVRIKNKRG